MMLKPLGLLLLLVVNIKPAEAHQTYYFEECDAYGIREKYSPGYYNDDGRYVRGGIKVNRYKIPCDTAPQQVHYQHQQPQNQYPYPYQPPIQQAVQTQGGKCDKLSRVGLLSLGGGIAGRYIAPSNKTILGTSIGAISGALLGSQLC